MCPILSWGVYNLGVVGARYPGAKYMREEVREESISSQLMPNDVKATIGQNQGLFAHGRDCNFKFGEGMCGAQ